MAETGIVVDTGTSGAGAGAQKTRTQTARPAQAKSVADFIGRAACASKLRQEGEAFISNVVEEAKKYDVDLKVTKILGDNYEARVMASNGSAVVLVFHETYVRKEMSHIPSISVISDVVRQFELKGGTEKIVNAIVVFKSMYESYERVTCGIINSLMSANEATYKDLAIGDFNSAGDLHVSMNLKEVISYAETTTGSPIGHADSGILLYAKQIDKERASYGSRDNSKIIPICAVTGYTDFKRVATDGFGSGFKYDPTFVITGVYSLIRTDEIEMLGIAIASDVFIKRGMWLNAFSSFAEGERNLGNLMVDPKTRKPYMCRNIADRQALMRDHFYIVPGQQVPVPLLAIDLQEGADQFPGVKDLLQNPDRVKAALAQFTGGENIKNFEIVQSETIQYDGLVDTNKGKVDTRAVDFLFLVDPKGAGVSHERAAGFLEYADPNDPAAVEKKAALLEEFYAADKIELAYKTHRVFLNPDFVDALADNYAASINFSIDSYVNNQAYDMSGLKRFQGALGGGMFTTGVTYGGMMRRGYSY